MKYKDAYEEYNGKNCLLRSPMWGVYYCKNVEVIKGGSGKHWKACGNIDTIADLPLQSRPPLKEGQSLAVSRGNVWLPDKDYVPIYPYKEAVKTLIANKRQAIKQDIELLKRGEHIPSESFNETLFMIMLSQLESMEARFLRRCQRESTSDVHEPSH